MKSKSLTITMIIWALFSLPNSDLQANNVNQSPEAVTILTNFYKSYIAEYASNSNPRVMATNINNLRKKYCTGSLLDKINKDIQGGLDYDPFLKAQDANADAIKTLTVTDGGVPNQYIVSYVDPYDKKKSSITLTLIKTTEGFKIDSVLY